MCIGLVLFGVLGVFYYPSIHFLFYSKYDRAGIERVCKEYFENPTNKSDSWRVKDALTEEIMIVSYEYNQREPRIYTKYSAQ